MLQSDPTPEVLVRKKKCRRHGHHGGAWKVAYADFATAMMAFFLVMWLMNQSTLVKGGIAGYFSDPIAYSEGVTGGAGEEGGLNPEAPGGPGNPEPLTREELIEQGREAMRLKAEEIAEAIASNPELQRNAAMIAVTVTSEGMLIELMESEEAVFFDVGSSDMSSGGLEAVRVIGGIVADLPNGVVVEGHTDSKPYSDDGRYSNWELSTDRANVARRVLEESGVHADRIDAVRGYASTRPRYEDDAEDPRNRRVSIIILNEGERGS